MYGMSQSSSRRAIHAYVSNQAHDRWHDFAAEEGVSVSALIEALAGELAGGETSPEQVADGLESVVATARRIDSDRRRRRKRS